MPIVDTLQTIYQKRGTYGVSRFIYQRYFSNEPYDFREIERFSRYRQYFREKNGIEIGGPSGIFRTEIPIYKNVASLDGCNFSTNTIWEGTLVEGMPYKFRDDRSGTQFVREASNLNGIEDEKYDFLLASHVLEHCANPLKAVKEWLRVIKPNGTILLVLPDKRLTFDHKRKVTSFGHLIDDLEANVGEDDMTHFDEIIKLHDLDLDNEYSNQSLTQEQFRTRSLDNLNNRCFHHHVFDFDLLDKVFGSCGIQKLDASWAEPWHQIMLGKKA